ncbi:YdjY domain-containing protein [bacterium]|nr:YdjY domain-containing protein [bacterium]
MLEVKGEKITIDGTIYPHRYSTRKDRANGHHFIVWSGGGNARKALIETKISDVNILEKLVQIGAKPGDNLTEKTWDERSDPKSIAPDQRVEGSQVRITVEWDGDEHEIWELIDGSESDFDIRVGGHKNLIPVWRSGCVTCLFSCPGGRTSNHAYTIRDQALNRKTFWAREDQLPKDGSKVKVHFYLLESSSSSD